MNCKQNAFSVFAVACGIAVLSAMLYGCSTAQKTEPPEWHYNMGRNDAQKEFRAVIDQANEYIQNLNTHAEDMRTGWGQCKERLDECLEAGSREK